MFVRITNFVLVICASICVHNSHAFNIENDLAFRLYTREVPIMYFVLRASGEPPVSQTPFNPSRPTRIFIHGFKSKEKTINRYAEAYLKSGDFNFIAVDWLKGSSTFNYLMAKGRVRPISEKLAELIDYLAANGLNLEDLSIVGHSLGAHIAGRAAKQLKSRKQIATIIGLDPASVGNDFYDKDKRLADSDAEYVQVIHTDGDKFGFAKPLGHADFYPNRGVAQPGCSNNILDNCSHTRSHHLFLESLTTKFKAIQCASYEEMRKNQCTSNNVTAIMGGDITQNIPKAYGIFYLETRAESPYNIPDQKSFNNIELILYEQ